MLANWVACLSKYGSALTFLWLCGFFSPSLILQLVAEVKRWEVKPCGVSARLSRCWPSVWDHVTHRHQSMVGFFFIFPPLNLSLEKKKKMPFAVKTNHMGFLFHLIQPRRIFPLLALLLVSGHVSPCFMSKNKSIFCGNQFAAGLAGNPQHCHFPTLTLSCIHLFKEQICRMNYRQICMQTSGYHKPEMIITVICTDSTNRMWNYHVSLATTIF